MKQQRTPIYRQLPISRRVMPGAALLFGVIVACGPADRASREKHAAGIIEQIAQTKAAIETSGANGRSLCTNQGDCVFIAIWDFDGTIIKGDCATGLEENGKTVYPGLLQTAVEKGHAERFRGVNGFRKFKAVYAALKKRDYRSALIFSPGAFAGARFSELQTLSRAQFKDVLQKHYFTSSLLILQGLRARGIESHVISASPHVFVSGAAETLDLPKDNFNGVRTVVENDVITKRIIEPVTFAEGKTKTILQIASAIRKKRGAKHVFVLAGFGDSWRTDGHFLDYVASQKLPAGRPLAVIFNAGAAPDLYRGRFLELKQEHTGRPLP